MKKKLLYISFIPYVLVLLYCLYHMIFGYYLGYVDRYEYGLDGFINAFSDVYDAVMFDGWVIVLIVMVIYQLWYFVFEYKTKGEKANVNQKKKKNQLFSKNGSIVKKIFFALSILCWIIYFGLGIYHYFFGFCGGFFSCSMRYGFDAMIEALFWYGLIFSFIPVLPITLIYIILYIVKMRKDKKKSI